jgi:4a-hydroxytetrahydrobiopterin dehydratase
MKMNQATIEQKLQNLSGWSYDDSKKAIVKKFEFKGYLKTIGFVNALAWLANKANHHPDLHVTFNTCTVTLTTHDQGGVSELDFTMAHEIEKL